MKNCVTSFNSLARQEILDEKFRDHVLTGEYRGFRECHIEPDWLLMYQIHDDMLILSAIATGTHAELFDE